jgi:sugar phosphate isomerase/epimerase
LQLRPLTLALLVAALVAAPVLANSSKIEFWDRQRKGANFFNIKEQPERFQAAKAFGIGLVRLAPNKWLNGRSEAELGDFLIGRPGSFKSINSSDVRLLKQVLDDADKCGMKVVITMLSLPGARWTQHNNNVEERKIWESFAEQEAAISFWRQLAGVLKDHPAVVGYNLRNEPSPELAKPRFPDWYTGDYEKWYRSVEGTPRDLNDFYKRVVSAIREVDQETPIVLDTGFYAAAWGIKVLKPLSDDKVIYSFHMYEPFAYTNFKNRKKFEYPGPVPTGEGDEPLVVHWDGKKMSEYFQPVVDWQKKNGIPSNRVLVGEFGLYRSSVGAEKYLHDLIENFNSNKWHWCFYSFREDNWDGMDYELGKGSPPPAYWNAIEDGKIPGPDVYAPNPLSDLLRNALKN